MNLEVTLLNSQTEFDQLRSEWNTLTERSAYPNIFTTWDWQSVWWKWFGTELRGKLRILTVHRVSETTTASELIGIVPFYRTDSFLPLFYGKKYLRLIGYGGRTCPEYLGPIIRQDCIDDVTEATVNFLKAQSNEWDSIFFEDYALDDPGTNALITRLKAAFTPLSGSGEIRYVLPLLENYEAYLMSLGSHNRKRKRLKMNQAKKRYNAYVKYQVADNIDEWFPLIVSLTTDARNRHTQASPFLEKIYAGFHRELLQSLIPQNRAMIQILYFNEIPVACWYAFCLHEKCYAYQQGSQQNIEGTPGEVGTFFLLEHLMENGFKEFDFLRGLEWYKTSYTEKFRETEWCFVFRKRGIAYWSRILLDCAARPVYRKVKQFFKQHFQRSVEKPQTAESEPQPSEPSPSEPRL